MGPQIGGASYYPAEAPMQQSGSEGGSRTRVIRHMKPSWRLSSLPRYFTSAQMTAFADFLTRLLNCRLMRLRTPGFQ